MCLEKIIEKIFTEIGETPSIGAFRFALYREGVCFRDINAVIANYSFLCSISDRFMRSL